MVHRKGLVRAAAIAALAYAGIVQAGTNTTPSDGGLTLRPIFLDAAATTATTAPDTAPATAPAASTPTPLMGLLEKLNIAKPLEDNNITIGGYVDVGYTVSLLNPSIGGFNGAIGGRFQDNTSNRVKLDQLDFFVDKPVDASKGKWDVGAHFEVIYGRDTDFFHSSRLYDNPSVLGDGSGTYYGGQDQPENQFDINQAYLDIAIPVGSGVRVRLGKFDTLLGYEVISPTGNPFYSHSFLFTYAIPLTQTGVMGEYVFNPDWKLDAGITLGWNQSLRDNNSSPDFLAEVTYTPQESDFLKKLNFVFNLSEGPQATHDDHDWWTVIDVIAKYTAVGDGKADGSVVVGVNGDYGDAPHGVLTHSAQWFGFAGYGQYIINSMFTVNARAEWYNDNTGFTLAGFAVPTTTPAGTVNLYEATAGLAITPFPNDAVGKNLVVRPEGRIDYAGRDFFPGGNPHLQATFGVDVYFIY